jgi:hypothetical protein
MIDAAIDQEREPIADKQPELSAHPGAALVQSMVDIPKSVAEALAEMSEEDQEEDVAPAEDLELDELYERLQAEPNPYFQMRTACKLILVASAQHLFTHLEQTFGNPVGELPAIVTSFVTCPEPVVADLRVLLDRTIQEFFRDNGLVGE